MVVETCIAATVSWNNLTWQTYICLSPTTNRNGLIHLQGHSGRRGGKWPGNHCLDGVCGEWGFLFLFRQNVMLF